MDDAIKRIHRTEGAKKLDNATHKPAIQSEISKQNEPAQVMDKILKTPLTIAIEEILRLFKNNLNNCKTLSSLNDLTLSPI